ncbi:MAG TPA: hypothetical protein PLS20_06205 [Ruminococcus flavefaciens]|nr:hypothetical protein [Ruminococcus flavefaciens]
MYLRQRDGRSCQAGIVNVLLWVMTDVFIRADAFPNPYGGFV